jgi:hypothetical protein
MAKTPTFDRKALLTIGGEFNVLLGYEQADADRPMIARKSMDDAALADALAKSIGDFIAGKVKSKKKKATVESTLSSASELLLSFVNEKGLYGADDDEEEEDDDLAEEDDDEEEGVENEDDDLADDADDDDDDADDEEDADDDDDEEEDDDDDDDDLLAGLDAVAPARAIAGADVAKAPKAKVDPKIAAMSAEQPAQHGIFIGANAEALVTAIITALSNGKAIVLTMGDVATLGATTSLTSDAAPVKKAAKASIVDDAEEDEAPAPAPKRRARSEAAAPAPAEATGPKLTKAQRKEVETYIAAQRDKIDALLMDKAKLRDIEARIEYIKTKGIDIAPYLTGPNKGKKITELGCKKLGNIIRDHVEKNAERRAIKNATAAK